MDLYGRSIRMGAAAIAVAVALRLGAGNLPQELRQVLTSPEVGSLLVYLETGRVIRPLPETEETEPDPTLPQPTEPEKPQFSGEDASLVYVWGTGEAVDPEVFLEMPLELDLLGDEVTVLILHTHATESYEQTPEQAYTESSYYRTLDTDHNMVAVGNYLEALLEAGGIRVVHDTTLHDYPQYNGSYSRSMETVQRYLEEYPTIQLVLDLHRDALSDGNGGELDTSAQVNGKESAQIMLLMGTDHENWQENMNLAVKLTTLLERRNPGLSRGILTRDYAYNQQLSPGALLVEMGAAGNTLEEAMTAASALAEAILALQNGA